MTINMFKNMKKQYMIPDMKVVRIRKMRMLTESLSQVQVNSEESLDQIYAE